MAARDNYEPLIENTDNGGVILSGPEAPQKNSKSDCSQTKKIDSFISFVISYFNSLTDGGSVDYDKG